MSVGVAYSDPLGAHGEGFLGFGEPEINNSNSTAYLTEQLITILTSTRDQTLEIIEQMGEDGELPRSILELVTRGQNAYEDALYSYRESDWSSAQDSAMEALGLYGDAMGLSLYIQSEIEDEDSPQEETIEVTVSLERTLSFFDKVLQLSEKLEQDGFNVTDVNSHLEDVREHISIAESYLENGENPEAEEERVISEGILTEALQCLEEMSANLKIEKASKFFKRTGGQRARAQYLEEKKERLENKGVDASHVKEKLKQVQNELEDEEASLNMGNAPGNAKSSEKPNNSNKKKD